MSFIRQQLACYRAFQRFFPLWGLRLQLRVVSREFDFEESKIRPSDYDSLAAFHAERSFELDEYEKKILAIQSRRLMVKARRHFVHMPDLRWEHSEYGDRFLDEASMSRLYGAVQEREEKRRDFYLKLAGAMTGIIGTVIGLVAVLKKH